MVAGFPSAGLLERTRHPHRSTRPIHPGGIHVVDPYPVMTAGPAKMADFFAVSNLGAANRLLNGGFAVGRS